MPETKSDWTIRILEKPEEMLEVEVLQRVVWTESETDILPAHILLAVAHNGGLVIGAYAGGQLVGVVFGFAGLEFVADGPIAKHHSHILAVHPDWRDKGVGYALKRAQWQVVRKQGLNHITWTYDPLLSRNANLNIARLGAVCNTYIKEYYGEMRDGLNLGLPSDRFQVDWWVNTKRAERRLSKRPRRALTLADYEKAGIKLLYESPLNAAGVPMPADSFDAPTEPLGLAEIPSDFMKLKDADMGLARDWRFFSREVFTLSFSTGYLVTDFIFDTTGSRARSFYVLAHGESTLEA
jgi:predicted GNAT superfamily acetyltransferase